MNVVRYLNIETDSKPVIVTNGKKLASPFKAGLVLSVMFRHLKNTLLVSKF